ncbi:hypothetical protein bmyco0003_41980 [Bacillus pseudomycoides]|nr:hypothetical protein bmyco0002_40880 [Bacillus pseudomycoides]EEM09138.1 hypothetical protein bmyco0003_41980 [Bacillus pseudomycoides]
MPFPAPYQVKTKRENKTSSNHLLFFVAATYMSKNQNGYI